jgi:hypothetical protein
MADEPTFFLLPFKRRSGRLEPTETLAFGSDEDRAFRAGRQMSERFAGMVFFRIDTSASGDQWTQVELLCTTGEVPDEDAA